MITGRIIFWSAVIALSGFIFLFSLISIINNWDEIKDSYHYDADSFSTTDGIILESEVGKEIYSSRNRENFSRVDIARYYPYIVYSFKIDNKKFISEKNALKRIRSGHFEYAQEYVKKYPVGNKVIVYFDPDNPNISILDPDTKEYSVGPITGILILPLGIITLILKLYFKQKRKPLDEKLEEKLDELVEDEEKNDGK